MNDYFDEDGHLADCALVGLIDDTLDELARFEIAEHLSFCDTCTERYTALLCDDCLLSPPEPLRKGVLCRIREQARVIFFNRYVTVGVAACFTMVLWVGGVFTPSITVREPHVLNQLTAISESITQSTSELGTKITENIQEIIGELQSFDLKGVFTHEEK